MRKMSKHKKPEYLLQLCYIGIKWPHVEIYTINNNGLVERLHKDAYKQINKQTNKQTSIGEILSN